MNEEAKRCVDALRTSCEENGSCPDCPVEFWCHSKNGVSLEDAAADLIESLSEQLEQVTRERDAAVKDLSAYRPCDACGYEPQEDACVRCRSYTDRPYWKWRGVEVEG